MGETEDAIHRGVALNNRIRTYWKVFGALMLAGTYAEAISVGLTTLATGSAMPKEEHDADDIVKQSQEAKDWASLPGWKFVNMYIAYDAKDAETIVTIYQMFDDYAGKYGGLEAEYGQRSALLSKAAADVKNEAYKLTIDSLMPREETATAGMDILRADALMRISNRLSSAADNYHDASIFIHGWVYQANHYADVCFDMLMFGFGIPNPYCFFEGFC
jgi:hypothetical protein